MNDTEQQLLAEQLRRYQAQAQTTAPQGRMVGRSFVRPHALEYIAAGLRGYGGMQGEQAVTKQLQDMATRRQESMAGALRGFAERMQDQPEQGVAATDSDPGYVIPGRRADPMAAYAQLMESGVPDLQRMGMQGMAQVPEMQARQREAEEARRFRGEQAEAERKARADSASLAFQQRQEQMTLAHELRMTEMAERRATREQMDQAQRDFQQQQAEAARAFQREMKKLGGAVAGAQPYFQPVQTAQGVFAFNARTGKVEPVTGPGGAPIVGAAADPALQGQIAGAREGAQTEAKLRTEARIDAPKAIAQAEQTLQLTDDLLKAPGLKQAVGASRLLGIQKIPGTPAKDFDVRLDQLRGQQFLQAFESLKGGGHITEVEGKKATDAIARMDAAQSEPSFIAAVKEFQGVIRIGLERAKRAQGGAPAAPSAPRRIRLDAQGNVIP